MNKSFKGLLAQDAVKRIRLSTNDGLTGYKIVKFKLMPFVFGGGSGELESVVKLYSVDPGDADEFINFDDPTIMGAAIINNDSSADSQPTVLTTVFDNTIVNQDMYVTHKNQHADGASVSFYVELEQIKLDLNESTVATLKDMRGRE